MTKQIKKVIDQMTTQGFKFISETPKLFSESPNVLIFEKNGSFYFTASGHSSMKRCSLSPAFSTLADATAIISHGFDFLSLKLTQVGMDMLSEMKKHSVGLDSSV